MKNASLETAKKISKEMNFVLHEPRSAMSGYGFKEVVSDELHGFLIDLLYADKVEDELFVLFLIQFFETNKNVPEEQLHMMLATICQSLDTIITHIAERPELIQP